jgi:hypothetical protein
MCIFIAWTIYQPIKFAAMSPQRCVQAMVPEYDFAGEVRQPSLVASRVSQGMAERNMIEDL